MREDLEAEQEERDEIEVTHEALQVAWWSPCGCVAMWRCGCDCT